MFVISGKQEFNTNTLKYKRYVMNIYSSTYKHKQKTFFKFKNEESD